MVFLGSFAPCPLSPLFSCFFNWTRGLFCLILRLHIHARRAKNVYDSRDCDRAVHDEKRWLYRCVIVDLTSEENYGNIFDFIDLTIFFSFVVSVDNPRGSSNILLGRVGLWGWRYPFALGTPAGRSPYLGLHGRVHTMCVWYRARWGHIDRCGDFYVLTADCVVSVQANVGG